MPRLIALCLLLTGCMAGPDYERPVLPLPEQHRVDADIELTGDELPQWQVVFQDPVLQGLIQRGLENNLDLAVARSRLREAEAALTRARAPLYPSIDLGTEGERERESELTDAGATEDTYTFLGLLSWELDIWGFTRRRAEAAEAALQSAQWSIYARQVSLIGAIAASYYNLVAVSEQIDVTNSTIATRVQALKIQELRNASGVISGLAVAQAKVALAEAEQQLPTLLNSRLVFENQLRRLLGEAPAAVTGTTALEDIPLETGLPPGLPAELLERRPDVRIAELGLVAANASVGVAKADLFPRVSLTGSFGNESAELSDLLDSAGRAWIATIGVVQPVFNAGDRRAALTAAWEVREQAQLAYTDTVLGSLEEVSNSIDRLARSNELSASTARLRDASREYLRLASLRYNNGVIDYIGVLDAQRQYFDAELSLIDAVRDQHLSIAQLYRALGGGWTPEES
ncbi:MAG: efflux transporter outer membrane subunit [Pseudomonadota bacterium]